LEEYKQLNLEAEASNNPQSQVQEALYNHPWEQREPS